MASDSSPAGGPSPPNPVARFSNRVDDYVAFRPGYPMALLGLLERECGLGPAAAVADVGSGTGKLTELLLRRARRVYAVEPNEAMRRAAERLLAGNPAFSSIGGRAEDTRLATGSVDLVTAAQAFHWFDPGPARAEFARILTHRGFVALIWNERREADSPFLAAYERFLDEFSVGYSEADHRRTAPRETIAAFLARSKVHEAELPNLQELDLAGLQGRYRSCSYALTRDHPRYEEAMARLAELFRQHEHGGRLIVPYRCQVYWGLP